MSELKVKRSYAIAWIIIITTDFVWSKIIMLYMICGGTLKWVGKWWFIALTTIDVVFSLSIIAAICYYSIKKIDSISPKI